MARKRRFNRGGNRGNRGNRGASGSGQRNPSQVPSRSPSPVPQRSADPNLPRRTRSLSPTSRGPLRWVERSRSVPPRDRSLVPRTHPPPPTESELAFMGIDFSGPGVPYEEPTQQELNQAAKEYNDYVSKRLDIAEKRLGSREQVTTLSNVPNHVLYDIGGDKLMFSLRDSHRDCGYYTEIWDHYVWIKGDANDPQSNLYAYVCTFVNRYRRLADGTVVRDRIQWDDKTTPIINLNRYPMITQEEQMSVVDYYRAITENEEQFISFTDPMINVRSSQMGNVNRHGVDHLCHQFVNNTPVVCPSRPN